MKYLSIEEIINIGLEVSNFQQIQFFNPEVVLYIREAGWLIGKTISQKLNIPLYSIKTSRVGKKIKNNFENFFNFLPWQVSHILRVIEMKLPIHKTLSKREIILDDDFPSDTDIRILLVDDAIDSGVSFSSVINFLKKNGYSNILSFVITTTSSKPIFIPDISYHNAIITFPWSIGSPEFHNYKLLYEQENKKK